MEEAVRKKMGEQKEPVIPDTPPPDGMYYVEAIKGHFYCRKTKQFLYLVKWHGFDDKANTYEPKSHLPTHLVEQYHEKLNNSKKK